MGILSVCQKWVQCNFSLNLTNSSTVTNDPIEITVPSISQHETATLAMDYDALKQIDNFVGGIQSYGYFFNHFFYCDFIYFLHLKSLV